MVTTICTSTFRTGDVDISDKIVNNYLVLDSSGFIKYRIINGICFVRFHKIKYGTNADNIPTDTLVLTGTPVPTVPTVSQLISTDNVLHYFTPTNNGILTNKSLGDTSLIVGTIIYPVAGQWSPEWN